jgi:hypothetical protein
MYVDCIFFYKLNADRVLYPVVMGELTSSARTMGVFYPSLLSYPCSDALIAMIRLSVIKVTYDLLLQCVFIVVIT